MNAARRDLSAAALRSVVGPRCLPSACAEKKITLGMNVFTYKTKENKMSQRGILKTGMPHKEICVRSLDGKLLRAGTKERTKQRCIF